MAFPVIAFDLDGTLIRPDKTIHPRDIEILNMVSGPVFVPVTARNLCSVKRLFGRYGLFAGEMLPFPVVCQYGSVLFGFYENLRHFKCFSLQTADELVNSMKVNSMVSSWLYTPYEIYTLNSTEFSEKNGEEFDFVFNPFREDTGMYFTKALAVAPEPSSIDFFMEIIKDLDLHASHYRSTILEICPPEVDKGRGLIQLLTDLDIKDSTIIAAGDTSYDLPLFEVADYSYAPLTAEDNIKRAAKSRIDVEKYGLLEPILKELD